MSQGLSFFRETLGIENVPKVFMEILLSFFGDKDVPATKFGLSSLTQLSLKSHHLWRGKFLSGKTVVITNLFNHTPTPLKDGWSVRKTKTCDFRGRKLTYDSHNGTDFAVPVGTRIVSPADGRVTKICNEFNRGGRKLFIDHGHGLITTYSHLGRIHVKKGELVSRGQVIALSGYSGIDGLLTFPFGIPHLHFNAWLNGYAVDPFLLSNGKSLWLNNSPTFFKENENYPSPRTSTKYSKSDIYQQLSYCKSQKIIDRIKNLNSLEEIGTEVIAETIYYPNRFEKTKSILEKEYELVNYLTLPFLSNDFDGYCFRDERSGIL